MFEAGLMIVVPRFKICFCHSYVFFFIIFVISFYYSFIYNCISSALTVQWACIFSAIARTGVIVITAGQKVLIVAGDNAFYVGGAAVANLYGVTVKDFAVFAVCGKVFRY